PASTSARVSGSACPATPATAPPRTCTSWSRPTAACAWYRCPSAWPARRASCTSRAPPPPPPRPEPPRPAPSPATGTARLTPPKCIVVLIHMDAGGLHINPALPEPIYRQITEQVRRLVAAGQLRPGEGLPSVREVAATHAVNPMTVSRAYSLLEAEGV